LIQFYNILEEKINSSFKYMIMRFSNTCDEHILRLLSRILYIFFVEEKLLFKKGKIN